MEGGRVGVKVGGGEIARGRTTGVGHQDVDLAEGGPGFGHHGLHGSWVGQVGDDGGAAVGQPGDGRVKPFGAPGYEADAYAGGGQGPGAGQAEASGTTGDQRSPSGDAEVHWCATASRRPGHRCWPWCRSRR